MIDFSLVSEASYFGFFIGILSVIAVAVSKAGFGGALASLSAPIMLIAFTPTQALGILLPLFLITDVWVVWFWRHLGVRRIIMFMTIAGLLGQLIGWAMLHFGALDDSMLRLFIGLMAILTALRYFMTQFGASKKVQTIRVRARAFRRKIASRAFLWCGLSGFTSFVSLTGGIPAQIYLLPLALPRQLFVATMAWFFLFINLAKIPFFADLQIMSAATFTLSALLLPFIPIGIILGRWMNKNLTDRLFYILVHFLLLGLGLQLLVRFFIGETTA